jgi:hypothetical protein
LAGKWFKEHLLTSPATMAGTLDASSHPLAVRALQETE